MKCRRGYVIQPLKSAAGYYIGTLDEDGCPNCRLSTGYAKTDVDALYLPLDRCAEEITFCNEGRGCLNDTNIDC